MPSTYTVNLGIEKPATGEQSGTWGDTTNTNFDILDQAINGAVRVTLTSAGTSGSPNQLQITNGAASDGRNKWIEIYSASDLGGSAYVQLDPNDAEKILFIRNSLAGSQSILLFQGTYNSGRDLEVPAGVDMVVKFDGGGASAATVTDVYTKLRVTELTTPTLTATTADINGGTLDNSVIGGTTAAAITGTTIVANTSLNIAGDGATVTGIKDEDDMSSNSPTKLATQQSIKAYVDSQVGTVDTWAEVLANGATSGSTNPEVTAGQALKTNTINETSAGSGVTIDSVLLKDDVVNATDIEVSSISANDGTEAATLANSTGVMTIASSVLTTTDINAGTIDNTTIGASTAAAGTFTTITSQSSSVSSSNPFIRLTDTDTGADTLLNAQSSAGSFFIDVDENNEGAGPIFSVAISGSEYFRITDSNTIFNENSASRDFRVEGNNNSHTLFVDGSADRVGINASTPNYDLDIAGATHVRTNFHQATYLSMIEDDTITITRGGSASSSEWVKLGTLDNPGQVKLIYRTGTSASEQRGTIEFGGTYTGSNLNLKVTTQTYNPNLLKVRVVQVGSGGTDYELWALIDNGADQTSDPYLQIQVYLAETQSISNRWINSMTTGTPGTAIEELDLTTASGATTTDVRNQTLYSGFTHNDRGAIFNEGGHDSDFRVEGDTDTHLLFVDASADKVGISDSAPAETLTVRDGPTMSAGWRRVLGLNAVYPVLAFTNNSNWAGIGMDGGASTPLQFWTNASTNDLVAGNAVLGLGKSGSESVFNDGSANIDFRIESNNNNNMVVVDADNDAVGIGGTPVSTAPLTVVGQYEESAGDGYDYNAALYPDTSLAIAQGKGTGILFMSEDAGSSARHAAHIQSARQSTVASNYTNDLVFSTRNNGEDMANVFKLTGDRNALFFDMTLDAGLGSRAVQITANNSSGNGPELLLHNPGQGSDATSLLTFGNKLSGTEGYTGVIYTTNNDGLHFGAANASTGFGTRPTSYLRISPSGGIKTTPPDSQEFVVNEGSSDSDFRVESNDNANMLLVDGSANEIYIGGTAAGSNVIALDAGRIRLDKSSDWNIESGGSSSNGSHIRFRLSGSDVGSITSTSSGTTYNTSSDRRLKTDIQPIEHATDMLMAMKPVSHRWKADPEADAVHGFIAQEMKEIVPEAVSGEPDGEEMMSMDYGRITPVLVAALQDAHKKIEALEKRLSEMEAK